MPVTIFRPPLRRLLVAACLVLAGCAETGPPGVATLLDARDLSLVAETTRMALEKNKVGQASNWLNGANGHRGTATPVRTTIQPDGTPCRRYQQTATANGRTIFAFDSACRRKDGAWISTNYGSLSAALARGGVSYRTYRPRSYYDDYPYCRWPYHDPWCWSGPHASFWYGHRLHHW